MSRAQAIRAVTDGAERCALCRPGVGIGIL
ncbi:hypothetical protein [Streptomyces chattanoogensis]